MKTALRSRHARSGQPKRRSAPLRTLGIRLFVSLSIPLTVAGDSDGEVIRALEEELGIPPWYEVLELVVTEVGGEPIRKEVPHESLVQAFGRTGH
jgi:hypothetical protein